MIRMSEPGVPLSETTEFTYLGRLLDSLELVGRPSRATSYRDAARQLGAPVSTAHRLLSLLIERGYCERGDDGRFGAGARMFGLATRVLEQLPRWQSAQRIVDELALATGESASFGVLVGREIVLTARRNSPHPLTAIANVGDILSPYTSALGKVILARLGEDQRAAVVDRHAPGEAKAILEGLQVELDSVDAAGYSVDEETFSPGMRCRAVPVVDATSGLVAGLSVSGPTVRFTAERAQSVVPLLLEAADRILSRPPPAAPAADSTREPSPAPN
jgi:IclR family acetate operon transcriptional repressor